MTTEITITYIYIYIYIIIGMDEIIVKVVYTKLLINTHTHCSNAVSSISWNGGNKYKDTRYTPAVI